MAAAWFQAAGHLDKNGSFVDLQLEIFKMILHQLQILQGQLSLIEQIGA